MIRAFRRLIIALVRLSFYFVKERIFRIKVKFN
jgi:hypothetical protein